ncbi:CynX/NimT family MFS transporter [Actinomadura roseirufa]|uniref:CynX/NimT family MFS transporter n=1 Tax=Actinomadura roseirufa TaxID=2094049 RepID=UPI001041A6BB|nr:MFS transporter [Actinomadura roseirufa]
MSQSIQKGRGSAILLGAGVVLIAANLRPAIASVATVLDQLHAGLGLSAAGANVLNALPVLLFGLGAPLAPVLTRRVGVERALLVALLLFIAGSLLRMVPAQTTLFAGTGVLAVGIAVANVLLPALVKRDFPDRIGLMSGLYTTSLAGAAAIAAGTTVPLGDALGLGWRGAIGVWTIPAVLALLVWLPQSGRPAAGDGPAPSTGVAGFLRDRRAWEFTVFMGLLSLTYHTVLAWLPAIYTAQGISSSTAGALLSVATIVATPVTLVLPALASRSPDQRRWVAGLTGFTVVGLTGLLVAPTTLPYLWAALLGLGMGAIFPLALTMIALRTRTGQDAAALSTMAQSVGYVIAGIGPLAVGALHDATGSWTPALAVLLVLLVPQTITGLASARDRLIGPRPQPVSPRTPARVRGQE